MTDSKSTDDPLSSLLLQAEGLLRPSADPIDLETLERLDGFLRDVEHRSPHGASLHAQLDAIAKWVRLLADPSSHARYGGTARLREHVELQFRLARAAAVDYTKSAG